MSDADKAVADAIAALDTLTVDGLESVDAETLWRLREITHHWSEVVASIMNARVRDARRD
jgi:hypothetical protein